MRATLLLVALTLLAGCVRDAPAPPPPGNDAMMPVTGAADGNRTLRWSANLTGDLAFRIDVANPTAGECTQRSAVETTATDSQPRFLAVTQHPDGQVDWYGVSGIRLAGAHAGPVQEGFGGPESRLASFTHSRQAFPATFTTWVFAHGLADLDEGYANGSVEFKLDCDGPVHATFVEGSRSLLLFDVGTHGGGAGANAGLLATATVADSFAFEVEGGDALRLVMQQFATAGVVQWSSPDAQHWVFDPQRDVLHLARGGTGGFAWSVEQAQAGYGGYFGAVAGMVAVPSLDDLGRLPS